jgi:hypothetical protein
MSSQRKAVKSYRRRLKRQGIVRVEVQVRKDDAPLVRKVAQALSDPTRGREARAILSEKFGERRPKDFKELLASLPLDGIDLTREDDFGRDVDL